MTKIYDDMMNFINIHYVGGRDDSDFWRWVKTGEIWTESTKNFMEMQKYKLIGPRDLDSYWGHAGSGLYNWIMAGLKVIDKKLAKKEMDFFGQWQLASDIWTIAEETMSKVSNDIIDNTEFIKNARLYSYGSDFPQ